METFLALLTFTEKGIRNIKDSPHRADVFAQTAEAGGARVVQQFWTMGRYDGLLIIEAPDDATAGAVLLELAASGNVRTETLRAFEWADFQSLVD